MKIAIIGAGFTGLSAAYTLSEKGHTVTVFEKDAQPGGLAIGFSKNIWEWTLEKHYHHWFTNDKSVLALAEKIHHPVVIKRPKTCVFLQDRVFQLDSPSRVLSFSPLPMLDRLRMAAVLGFLRYNPFWKPLEKYNATPFLSKTMGKKAYEMLWQPQMNSKFGSYAKNISLAWFWARVSKRTASLAYPQGGFLSFANHLVKILEKKHTSFSFSTEITRIEQKETTVLVTSKDKNSEKKEVFDKVLVTLPSFFFTHITPQLSDTYKKSLLSLEGLGAINVVLRLNKPFFSDNTYWLSVCDKTAKVLAIVEHTNFMDKKYYHNEHLVYLGNYLPKNHPYFSMDKNQLLEIYNPTLQKIHPGYEKNIIGIEMFAVPFAQPIIPPNYSKKIPKFKTPLPHVYLANMQQVYPWDRGTNYAVEIGEHVANLMCQE